MVQALSTKNPLADIAQRATTQSATAATEKSLRVGQPITGEYLYNEYCTPDKTELTKVRLIEAWANPNSGHAIATDVLNKAIKDMVEIAGNINEAAKKTAQNRGAEIRQIFGALKFAPNDLLESGYEVGRTGMRAGAILAQRVLKAKGINWTGVQAKTEEQRQRERDTKAHKAALEAAMSENPQRLDEEDYSAYMARILKIAEQKKTEIDAAARLDQVRKLAKTVKMQCGELLGEVIQCLLDEATEAQGEEMPVHPTQGE